MKLIEGIILGVGAAALIGGGIYVAVQPKSPASVLREPGSQLITNMRDEGSSGRSTSSLERTASKAVSTAKTASQLISDGKSLFGSARSLFS